MIAVLALVIKRQLDIAPTSWMNEKHIFDKFLQWEKQRLFDTD